MELLIPPQEKEKEESPFTWQFDLSSLPKPFWGKAWKISRVNIPLAIRVNSGSAEPFTLYTDLRIYSNKRTIWSASLNQEMVNNEGSGIHVANLLFTGDFTNPLTYTDCDNLSLELDASVRPAKGLVFIAYLAQSLDTGGHHTPLSAWFDYEQED